MVAIIFIRPALTYGMTERNGSATRSMRPPISSVCAGALPLNGECSMSMPVSRLSSSVPRCVVLPAPGVP